MLSAKASAGQEASIPVILTNSGTAPAEQIELSGTAPTGWKIEFRAQDRRSHRARTRTRKCRRWSRPPPRPIAGDYVTTVRAAARGEFGLAVVPRRGHDLDAVGHRRCRASSAIALLVMVGAVVWFGRR